MQAFYQTHLAKAIKLNHRSARIARSGSSAGYGYPARA